MVIKEYWWPTNFLVFFLILGCLAITTCYIHNQIIKPIRNMSILAQSILSKGNGTSEQEKRF